VPTDTPHVVDEQILGQELLVVHKLWWVKQVIEAYVGRLMPATNKSRTTCSHLWMQNII
jgi:hypothetical protein